MNEFLEQFLIEGRELRDQATRDLLELEQNTGDRERLDGAFRAVHTLKGAAGIVDFDDMGRALHAVEDALANVRSGKTAVTPELITRCLAGIDQVSAWLRAIETSGELPTNTGAEADRLVALFATASVQPKASPALEGSQLTRAHDLIEAQILLVSNPETGNAARASALRVAANVLVHVGRPEEARRLAATVQTADVEEALTALQAAFFVLSAPVSASSRRDDSARSLRVDVARVDALVKLTGELTTTKNAIGHLSELVRKGASPEAVAEQLREQHVSLDRLVNELQRSVLSVRVLPMAHVFQRFPRVVREMSAELGKPARLITEGEDTEADKAIVEALFEPLLHVVRNALDHGIEEPELRTARGKPAVAQVLVRARREGEHVIVEVEDDGGGINVARVRELAVERGIGDAEAIAEMSDSEAVDLIFQAGFSTASVVTAISGRGVGMDAVRTTVESMGGEVAIENRSGLGTTVRFLLPFTLMVTRVMTVFAGGQSFGIPFDAIVETVRTPRTSISAIGAAHAFVYRNQTVPVIDLGETLGTSKAASSALATVVVTDVAGELTAFEVESVGSSLDVMLSPLDGLLSGAPGIAGATLLGDGAVLLVLDLHEFAR